MGEIFDLLKDSSFNSTEVANTLELKGKTVWRWRKKIHEGLTREEFMLLRLAINDKFLKKDQTKRPIRLDVAKPFQVALKRLRSQYAAADEIVHESVDSGTLSSMHQQLKEINFRALKGKGIASPNAGVLNHRIPGANNPLMNFAKLKVHKLSSSLAPAMFHDTNAYVPGPQPQQNVLHKKFNFTDSSNTQLYVQKAFTYMLLFNTLLYFFNIMQHCLIQQTPKNKRFYHAHKIFSGLNASCHGNCFYQGLTLPQSIA